MIVYRQRLLPVHPRTAQGKEKRKKKNKKKTRKSIATLFALHKNAIKWCLPFRLKTKTSELLSTKYIKNTKLFAMESHRQVYKVSKSEILHYVKNNQNN